MKNVIFISPNFPENYWHFCHELKENGMNVLGIGDCPYDDLRPELQESLQEYYKVDSLENYDEVYGAVSATLSGITVALTGWNPTMNTGWSRMPVCVQISIFRAVFITKTCHASNTNPA